MIPSSLLPSARQTLTLQRKVSVRAVVALVGLIGLDVACILAEMHKHTEGTKFWFVFGGLTLLVILMAYAMVDCNAHPDKYSLVLTPEGFTVGPGKTRGQKTWKWDNVNGFRMEKSRHSRQIVFDPVDNAPMSLASSYETMKDEDVAELLNQWREYYTHKKPGPPGET